MQHVRDLSGATALASSKALYFEAERARARAYVKDAFQTYDAAVFDSAGAFLIGELERLDPKVHEPLVAVTWYRDIDLRTDVQMGDEASSFITSTYGMVGQPDTGNGLNWASSISTTLARPQLDVDKTLHGLRLWAAEVAYTVVELEKARLTGRPIDEQQLGALNRKHQMDTDQMVYIGDSTLSATGLVNNSLVTPSNVPNGALGSPLWKNKTPTEILGDVNAMVVAAWASTGYSTPPTKLLIAPVEFGYIATTLIAVASSTGSVSILKYIRENNILTAERGIPLEIQSCKWLDKANINGPGGAAATYDRMVCYHQNSDYVRYPMVPLVPMAPQYQGLFIKVPYYGRLGELEVVYPQCMAYRDGIG